MIVWRRDDDGQHGGRDPRTIVLRSNRAFTLAVRPGFAVRAAASATSAIAMWGSASVGLDSLVDRGLAVLDGARPGDEPKALADYAAAIDGHFCMAAITDDGVVLVTDHLGSIPVYRSIDSTGVIAGTALTDLVEHRAATIDPASAVQFVRDGVITAPFTLFTGVTRQDPATVQAVSRQQTLRYWYPPTPDRLDLDQAAAELDEALRGVFARLADRTDRVTVLFSGGDDSRVIAGYARAAGLRIRAVTLADSMNREVRHARWAARLLGLDLDVRMRPEGHDVLGLRERMQVVGAGYDIAHTHAFGLVDDEDAEAPLLDGWYAALLKSDDVPQVRRSVRRIPMGLAKVDRRPRRASHDEGAEGIDQELRRRWALKRDRLAGLDEAAVDEWMACLPASDSISYPFFAYNRARFGGISPLALPSIVRIASSVAADLRINRRLFKQAFARTLGPSAWVPRTDGEIMALPPRLDVAVSAVNQVAYRLAYRLTRDASQGPWTIERRRASAVDRLMESIGADEFEAVISLSPELRAHVARRWRARYRAIQLAEVLRDHPLG